MERIKEMLNKLKGYYENKPKYRRYLDAFILAILLIYMGSYIVARIANAQIQEVPYNEFISLVENGKVKEVYINFNHPKFIFLKEGGKTPYKTSNPMTTNFKEYLLKHNVKVNDIIPKQISLASFFELVLYAILIYFVFNSMNEFNNLGKTVNSEEAKKNIPNVTFKSVAGLNEIKEDMQYIVDFLKNPEPYIKQGARLPKGIVFYGPPGTGKTLTAKALAGEARVPFFSVSGSDFVEMFVGLGAKRVRNLFEKARKNAPCIIFIDEIDAVGRKRGADSNSEKDQTINALLNEMDGVKDNEGILVICATNRIEDLDAALIRPGRFDRHIAINLPDCEARYEILKTHAKNKTLDESVDLKQIAKMTIGFSGATLETLLNEAAIISVQRKSPCITKEHIDEAFFKIVMKGNKKQVKDRKEDEIKITAYHEAGHALATKLLTDNSVPKITIIPSTSGAGGATFVTPQKMGMLSKKDLLNQVKISYAGRAAELIFLKDEELVTNGASQDIAQATDIIKEMIMTYGMSDAGPLNLRQLGVDEAELLEKAQKLADKLFQETKDLLKENETLLHKIAQELMAKETLSEEELDILIKEHLQKMVA